MEVIWNALEALTVDGCIFAGDTKMHAEEVIPQQYREEWDYAWEVDGADVALSGTWCQEWMETTHPLVQSWRFDRILFLSKFFTVLLKTHPLRMLLPLVTSSRKP